jgi:Gamma-glutamyl cyclotransferase, AIG2-like
MYLFSYGTLQIPAVQIATFGRKLDGKPDALIGYTMKTIEIKDHKFAGASGPSYHRTVQFTGISSDIVDGTLFTLTDEELEKADRYEPPGYKRVLAPVRSGVRAWVYMKP